MLSCRCPFWLFLLTLSLILEVKKTASGKTMQAVNVSNGLISSSVMAKTRIWKGSLVNSRMLFLMTLFTSCMSALSRVIMSPLRWVV